MRVNSFRWKGLPYDSATGLYYMRARYYDPNLRRFISQDPIGLDGGINEYAFASGDPINRSDPTGLDDCKWEYVDGGAYWTTYDEYGNHGGWIDPPHMDYKCQEETKHRWEDPAAGDGAGDGGHGGNGGVATIVSTIKKMLPENFKSCGGGVFSLVGVGTHNEFFNAGIYVIPAAWDSRTGGSSGLLLEASAGKTGRRV